MHTVRRQFVGLVRPYVGCTAEAGTHYDVLERPNPHIMNWKVFGSIGPAGIDTLHGKMSSMGCLDGDGGNSRSMLLLFGRPTGVLLFLAVLSGQVSAVGRCCGLDSGRFVNDV